MDLPATLVEETPDRIRLQQNKVHMLLAYFSYFISACKLPEAATSPFRFANCVPLTDNCLSYIRLPKTPSQYIFALKMKTAISAKTLDNFQYSKLIILQNLCPTLAYSCQNVWKIIKKKVDEN
jgi:hypothetical protein